MSPPGCSVKGIRNKKYKGETALLIFQNLHRFTLYLAIAIIFILSYDAIYHFFKMEYLV